MRELKSNLSGSVFALQHDNTLLQLDSNAAVVRRFAGQRAAPFRHIHFWNRWQTFLFSPDNQTITLLDRFLTPIDQYRLELSLGWVHLAAPSADQSIWLFEETSLRLLRYDLQLREVIGQTALNVLLADAAQTPDQLEEYQNQLFLNVPEFGILIFDALGNFREKLPFSATGRFQFRGDRLCFWEATEQRFLCWHLYKRQRQYVPSAYPDKVFSRALWQEGQHWYVSKAGITIWKK